MSKQLSRKRTLRETIPDAIADGPPKKKLKTVIRSALRKTKQPDSACAPQVTIYYQIPDYTAEQIHNILSTTIKGSTRPLLLFSDNDIDNYWFRLNRNKHYKYSKNQRQQVYDHDANALLIGKYDNYNNSDFLSIGIITNYIANDRVPKEWDEFEKNINGSFEIIFELIKKKKIRHIIIPSKYPLSKNNTKEIFHRLNYGCHLKERHLRYIQSKINELEQKFATHYLFINQPLYFDDKASAMPQNGISGWNKNAQSNEFSKESKKIVRFEIESAEPVKTVQKIVEKETKKDRRETKLEMKDKPHLANPSEKKKNKRKPPLVQQPTLLIEDETSPSPFASSMDDTMSLRTTYRQFPDDFNRRDEMLSMTQYAPITMSYQQYKAQLESDARQTEMNNLISLRKWEQRKVDEYEQIQLIQQIKRESVSDISPSIELSTSLPPFNEHLSRYKSEPNIRMWRILIKLFAFIIAIWTVWSVFKCIADLTKPVPPIIVTTQSNEIHFVWLWCALCLLLAMLCMGIIFGDKTHANPIFWISWLMFVVICYRAIKDIVDYDASDADGYPYLYDDDDDYDYDYNNAYNKPVHVHTEDESVHFDSKTANDVQQTIPNDCDDTTAFGGDLWIRHGVDVLLWSLFILILWLCLPSHEKRRRFMIMFTVAAMMVFGYGVDMVSRHLHLDHSQVMNTFGGLISSVAIPSCIVLPLCVHITRCLNINHAHDMAQMMLSVLILFWMYYDAILAVQFLLIACFVYIVCTNCISYLNMHHMERKQDRKRRRKDRRRKRIHEMHTQHFNPYADMITNKSSQISVRSSTKRSRKRSYASYVELRRNRQRMRDMQFW
eukprot:982369_1